MKNTTLVLKLVGFSSSEFTAFSAVLSLSETKLNHNWRVVGIEEPTADFFVLVDRTARANQIVLTKSPLTEQCRACTSESCADKNNVIVSNDNLVPRLSSLTQMLNQAALDVVKGNTMIQVAVESSCAELVVNQLVTANMDFCFNPSQGILKHLLQTNDEPLAITFSTPTTCIDIYLHPAQGVYFCQSDLAQLDICFAPNSQLATRVLSTAQLNASVAHAALSPKSLSDLIWYVAFNLSHGRLLKGHSSQAVVYLTNWPNLEIPGCQRYVRLAAFMQNNAVCLDIAASKTATPLAEVYNFYNACYLVGLVEQTDQTELHEKNLTDSEKVLLVTIASRLKTFHSEYGGAS